MMTLARLAPPTNRSAAARTLKVSTRSHRVPIALTRRTSILRMPPSKRKAGSERTIMRTGLASPAGAPPGCQPRAPAAHACGTSPSRAVRGFVERACARAVDDAPPQPPMLEVADHGRVIVMYDDAEAPGKAESPNAAPEAPGEVESPARNRNVERAEPVPVHKYLFVRQFTRMCISPPQFNAHSATGRTGGHGLIAPPHTRDRTQTWVPSARVKHGARAASLACGHPGPPG